MLKYSLVLVPKILESKIRKPRLITIEAVEIDIQSTYKNEDSTKRIYV